MRELLIRQGFRIYGIGLLIAALWTGAWLGAGVGSIPAVGVSWIVIAGLGVVLLVAVIEHRDVFEVDDTRRRTFLDMSLSGTPLSAYIVGLLAMALVTVGWIGTGFALLPTAAIAVAWYGLAAYGGLLCLAMATAHADDIAALVSPSAADS